MIPAKGQLALAAFILAAGLAVTALAVRSYVQGRALADRGAIIDAQLTATDHRESDSDTGLQVKYRFRVGDRDYERIGVFGTSVWSDVTSDTLAAAELSRRVSVRYLPENPAVNEPVAHARPQAPRGLVGIGFGLFFVLAALVRGGMAWQRLHAARARAES